MITKKYNSKKEKIVRRKKKRKLILSKSDIFNYTLLEFRLLYQSYGYDYPIHLVNL